MGISKIEELEVKISSLEAGIAELKITINNTPFNERAEGNYKNNLDELENAETVLKQAKEEFNKEDQKQRKVSERQKIALQHSRNTSPEVNPTVQQARRQQNHKQAMENIRNTLTK